MQPGPVGCLRQRSGGGVASECVDGAAAWRGHVHVHVVGADRHTFGVAQGQARGAAGGRGLDQTAGGIRRLGEGTGRGVTGEHRDRAADKCHHVDVRTVQTDRDAVRTVERPAGDAPRPGGVRDAAAAAQLGQSAGRPIAMEAEHRVAAHRRRVDVLAVGADRDRVGTARPTARAQPLAPARAMQPAVPGRWLSAPVRASRVKIAIAWLSEDAT